jgi:hypothetical protein
MAQFARGSRPEDILRVHVEPDAPLSDSPDENPLMPQSL